MAAAERIAARYRSDPRINALCQVVIPVAGLIAQAATTLRQDEANALRAIALLDRSRSTELLLSAPRFVSLDAPPGLEAEVRARLLDRLGLFGVRLAVELIIAGRVNSAGELARELEARSGILELRQVLGGHFASRSQVLKARSTLATVWALAELHGGPQGRMLRDRIRDIERGAHELVEIRLLSAAAPRFDHPRGVGVGSAPHPRRRRSRTGRPPRAAGRRVDRRHPLGGDRDDRSLAGRRRGSTADPGRPRRRPRGDPQLRSARRRGALIDTGRSVGPSYTRALGHPQE